MSKWNSARARALKQKKGLTTAFIAKECGIEPRSMSALFRGDRNPGFPLLILLARMLDTTPAELWPERAREAELESHHRATGT